MSLFPNSVAYVVVQDFCQLICEMCYINPLTSVDLWNVLH